MTARLTINVTASMTVPGGQMSEETHPGGAMSYTRSRGQGDVARDFNFMRVEKCYLPQHQGQRHGAETCALTSTGRVSELWLWL